MDADADRIIEISVADLVPHPGNEVFRQMTDDELNELAESLQERGFIHPLVVRPFGMGSYQVLSGHQRLRAARLLGVDKVPCVVAALDDDAAEDVLLDANLRARHLSPMEQARAIRRKQELMGDRRGRRRKEPQNGANSWDGKTTEIIAEQMGISKTQVERIAALNDLIPELQSLVEAGALGVSAGSAMARLPPETQRLLWEALGASVGDLRVDEVKRLRQESERAGIVIEALARQVRELEGKIKLGQGEGELRTEIDRLQARKRQLEFQVQDQLALRRQLERKPGARLLELMVAATRPLAQARPELETILNGALLDAPTAVNLKPHLDLLCDVVKMLEAAVARDGPPRLLSRSQH